MNRRAATRPVLVLAATLVLAACGSGGGTSPSASSAGSSSPSSSAGDQVLPAPVDPTAAVTVQKPPASVTPPPGISGLLAWDTAGYPGPGKSGPGSLESAHVPGPVTYAVTPPVGGPHAAVWANAGVYTAPIPTERGVHDLEHGAVWITYDPSLSASDVAALTAFVAKQSMIPESAQGLPDGQANRYVLMSPWGSGSLPSPIVISAWGYQLRVSSPTDPRLQQFVDMFRNSKTYSPEFGSPVDGVPVPLGGRAASNGSALPNPAS